jgi:acyl-CoA thioester hydrolase
MPRLFVDLPDSFAFSTEVPLYTSHINKSGHLDNALLLTIVSEARARYFASLGYDEDDIEGLSTITADVAVQYKSEAFYGQVMVVELRARDFNRYGYDLVFRLSDKATGREVSRGKQGFVFFDHSIKKVSPMPAAFRRLIEA